MSQFNFKAPAAATPAATVVPPTAAATSGPEAPATPVAPATVAATPDPGLVAPPVAPTEPPAAEVTGLIRMYRSGDTGPFEADVHPDEVRNYADGGWRLEKV